MLLRNCLRMAQEELGGAAKATGCFEPFRLCDLKRFTKIDKKSQ